MDELLQYIQGIYLAITGWWDWFSAGGAIRDVVGWLASILPAQNADVDGVISLMTAWIGFILPFVALLGYFVNIHLIFVVAGIVLVTETALVVPRIWKWILQLAPFA